MVIFIITSADLADLADVVLKMNTILKEMKIAQLCSKSERTLGTYLKKFYSDHYTLKKVKKKFGNLKKKSFTVKYI